MIKEMLRIAVPLALAELGWMAMSVIDNIMVGRLPDSATAIGSASVGSALFYSLAIFGIGLISGLDPLVSRAFGAGDMADARRSMVAGLALSVLLTVPLVGTIVAAEPVLGWIGVRSPVREQAVGFSRILMWSLPMLLLMSVLRRYLQGLHHVRPIAFAVVSGNAINLLGNWLLIFGHLGFPAMGVRGSALSTVAARVWLCGVMALAVRLRDPDAFRGMSVSGERIRELWRLGMPAGVTIGLEVAGFNASTAVAGRLDAASLAAHTIALNAASVAYMVPLGVASAAAVSVGKALGERDPAKAVRAGWTAIGIVVAFEICSATIFVLVPGWLARVYTVDPAVVAATVALFVLVAAFQVVDGLQTVATGALRGLGNTKAAAVWNLVGYWILGLPFGIWLCFWQGWGIRGIWIGLTFALFLVAAGLVWTWRRDSLLTVRSGQALNDR
jgi:MATE family multidrug resistance protein